MVCSSQSMQVWNFFVSADIWWGSFPRWWVPGSRGSICSLRHQWCWQRSHWDNRPLFCSSKWVVDLGYNHIQTMSKTSAMLPVIQTVDVFCCGKWVVDLGCTLIQTVSKTSTMLPIIQTIDISCSGKCTQRLGLFWHLDKIISNTHCQKNNSALVVGVFKNWVSAPIETFNLSPSLVSVLRGWVKLTVRQSILFW